METSKSLRYPLWLRLTAIPGLAITTLLSILLLGASISGWTTTGSLYHLAVNSRASVQIVVHIVSWVFGAAQIFSVYALIKARVNTQLKQSSVTLNELSFWLSISSNCPDPTLPVPLLLYSLLLIFLLSVPSILWAGATTPVIVSTNGPSTGIPVALYTEATVNYWNLTCDWCWAGGRDAVEIPTSKGYIGDLPLYGDQGMFLVQASLASSQTGMAQTHTKNDNSEYNYKGRSYGAGAPVGLLTPSTVQGFQYYEDGYLTKAECLTNSTLPAALVLMYNATEANNSIMPNIWQPTGYLPNEESQLWADLMAVSLDGDWSVFGVLCSSSAGRYMYRMVPGSGYAMFKDMQCELIFTPTCFVIVVDVVAKTIQVTPGTVGAGENDIEPTGAIKIMAFQQLWVYAQMDSTTLSSLVGNALVNNVANVARQSGQNSSIDAEVLDGGTTDAIRFRGVAEAIESIVDNGLLTFATTQLFNKNGMATTTATTNATIETVVLAVRFGTPAYTYALFGTVVITALAFVAELSRTRCWADLPAFNVTSVQNSIVGASAGGQSIAQAASDAGRRAGRVSMRLQPTGEGGFAMILADNVYQLHSIVTGSQDPADSLATSRYHGSNMVKADGAREGGGGETDPLSLAPQVSLPEFESLESLPRGFV